MDFSKKEVFMLKRANFKENTYTEQNKQKRIERKPSDRVLKSRKKPSNDLIIEHSRSHSKRKTISKCNKES